MIDEENTADILSLPVKDASHESLTEWDNPPKLTDLKQDLEDSKSDHDTHVSDVNTWLDNLNMTGSAKIKKESGRSAIAPQLIRKQAEWRYASLSEPFLSTDDVFNTDPISYEDKQAAIQNGLVLNNQFNTKINKIKFIDEFVRAAVDEGTAIVRVGWDFQEEEVEEEVEQFEYHFDNSQETLSLHQDLFNMARDEPERFEQEVPEQLKEAHRITLEENEPYIPISIGFETVKSLKTVRNCPTVELCDYRNITIDPSCMGDMSKAKFAIYSFATSLAELEAEEGKYTNLDKIVIDNNSILGDPDHAGSDDSSFNFNDQPRKKFVAYEYWGFWDIDGSGELKPIVATWVGDTLIRLEENPFPDKQIPFVVVQYLPVRRSIYGQPDGALLEDNQKIIGAVTRGMIDVIGRSANGQMGSRKDALDVTNKRKFDQGKDYEFNANIDPRQAFHMHTFPEIPQSAQLMLQLQNAEAESLTGVKAFTSGISGQALGNTATGIRSALDATSKRELGILRRLADGMKQIGRKIISMNAEFLDEVEVVRITNEEFVEVRRDDLAGNFDISLTISTAEADEHKAQELAFMLQTMGNNMDPAMSQMILSDIARLRKMPTLSKSIRDYQPQPDPLEQRRQELEIQLLEAQIYNETAKGNENNANGQLDQAKARTEIAKARNLDSDSDAKDLDFIEQESGVHQERTLEKMDRQTQGNLALKERDGQNKVAEKVVDANLTTALQGLTNV